jgi:DNA-binding transcriptional LysR family regulator
MDRIEQMRAFIAVVAAGGFTAAAEKIGSTPQLVSKYVAALEDDLGARLLNRTTRRVALTEAGRAYHPRCLALLEQFDDLRSEMREERTRPRGLLSVAAPITFGELYLAPAVHAFAQAWPEVSVDLRLTDRFVDLIEEGVDMAVRVGQLEDSALVARKLADIPVLCVASPTYLAGAARIAIPEDLTHHACLIDTNFREPDDWPFLVDGRRLSVRVAGQLRVNSAAAIRTLAVAGAGVALCPAYAVGKDVAAGRLTSLLGGAAMTLGVHAVYPGVRHLTARVRSFVDHLAKSLREAS